MPHELVIRGGRVQADAWRVVGLEDAETQAPLAEGPLVVPLALWRARRAELLRRREPVGVWLDPGEEPEALAADFAVLALIAVRFPRFTDGRGYSIASLLRRRHGYRGELRAFGDIGRDQLYYLARVGFDSFLLPPHRDPHAALAAFDDFSVRYQASADGTPPLFRARADEARHG